MNIDIIETIDTSNVSFDISQPCKTPKMLRYSRKIRKCSAEPDYVFSNMEHRKKRKCKRFLILIFFLLGAWGCYYGSIKEHGQNWQIYQEQEKRMARNHPPILCYTAGSFKGEFDPNGLKIIPCHPRGPEAPACFFGYVFFWEDDVYKSSASLGCSTLEQCLKQEVPSAELVRRARPKARNIKNTVGCCEADACNGKILTRKEIEKYRNELSLHNCCADTWKWGQWFFIYACTFQEIHL